MMLVLSNIHHVLHIPYTPRFFRLGTIGNSQMIVIRYNRGKSLEIKIDLACSVQSFSTISAEPVRGKSGINNLQK